MEKFKKTAGFDGYQIGEFGTLLNKDGTIKTTSIDRYGYKRAGLRVCKGSKSKTVSIHRLVALAFHDNPQNYTDVNHIDGDKLNNSAKNLEWCTRQQNIIHSYKLGLSKNGENRSTAKLNNEMVLLIKENKEGLTRRQMAVKYLVSRQTIDKTLNGKRWTHIEINK